MLLGEAQKIILGQNGLIRINDTTDHPNINVGAFTAMSDTVIAVLEGSDITAADWPGLPVPKGVTIYGRFSRIQLTSGQLVCYKGPRKMPLTQT